MKKRKKLNSQNKDIEHILYKCSLGNRRAQEHLYKIHYGYAMSIALRFSNSRESASEILNDSFLKTFRFLTDGGKIENILPWLRKTIINQSIDYYRKNKTLQEHITYEEFIPETIFDNNAISGLTAEEIIAKLQKLPEIYRLVFTLFEIEGYSHKEIGEKLEISEVASRKNLSRAKSQLKMMLEKTIAYE
jgi:RNA polymerase sigma factor (sigma-70 family)